MWCVRYLCIRRLIMLLIPGGSVIWLPETSLALWVHFPSIFMSKIILYSISWKPGRHFPFLISSAVCEIFSKTTLAFTISLWIVNYQKLVPVARYISGASLAAFGILIPNLWVRFQYFVLDLEIMRSLWRNKWPTHQFNDGSSWILFAIAYSARSIGLDFLLSFNGTHYTKPPFHSNCRVYPLFVFFALNLPDLLVKITLVYWW